jgi:hypothetical protein
VLALLVGALPGKASAGSCPNEEIRVEQGSQRLPDCRAFELVTPQAKADNSNIGGFRGLPFAFPDGVHVYYPSFLPEPGAQSGIEGENLSTRTASGWVNTTLSPPAIGHVAAGAFAEFPLEVAFISDFSTAFVDSLFDSDPLDQDRVKDAYRVDLSSGASSLAGLPDTGPMTAALNPPGIGGAAGPGTFIAGVSEDGSHVLFETFDQLPVAPGAPSEPQHKGAMVYDRTGGHTYPVGVLPGEKISQTCPAELGDGRAYTRNHSGMLYGAISPDGTNVVFTMRATSSGESCGPDEGVYLRENNATTVKLAGDHYIARSSDGSKIFTINVQGASEEVAGLYEYDVASGTTTTISPEGAFVASSADGSRVYYLTGITNTTNEIHSEGINEPYRLYLWDKGTSTLIPQAGEGFASYINPAGTFFASAGDQPVATPDGSKLLFLDRASLTGYNNFGPCLERAGGGRPGFCSEAFVYDATAGSVTCVSCSPTGSPPLGNAHLKGGEQLDTLLPGYPEGEISPDGSRVFFETQDALVPQDTNGLPDVYEWENGRIYLISSGQGASGSFFAGASSNGDDAFFTTTDHLAPQDIETATQIYDARVDGGFPYRPFTTGCDSGQCQGPQTPAPTFGAPASATFVGLGNPAPAVSALAVKRQLKPKAKHKKKKTRAKKARKSNHGRRASR